MFKNRGNPTYTCTGNFCVGLRTTTFEDFISECVIVRMRRPDVMELLAALHDTGPTVEAGESAAELQARLDDFYAAAAAGTISATGMAAIENRLLPQIAEAKRLEFVPPSIPRSVIDLAKAPDPAVMWATLPALVRREIVGVLIDVKLGTVGKGHRIFRPERLGPSRWVGDSMTWAEHWAAQN